MTLVPVHTLPTPSLALLLLLLGACHAGAPDSKEKDDSKADSADTGKDSDTDDSSDDSDSDQDSDTNESGETGDTGETADSGDTMETGETADSGETGDTSDTEDSADTGGPMLVDVMHSAWLTFYSGEWGVRLGDPYVLGDVTGDDIEDVCFEMSGPDLCYGFRSPIPSGEREVADADFSISVGFEKGDLAVPGDLNGDGIDDLNLGDWVFLGPLLDEESSSTADITIDYDSESWAVHSRQLDPGDSNDDGANDLLLNFWDRGDGFTYNYLHVFTSLDGSSLSQDDAAATVRIFSSFEGYSATYDFTFIGDTNGDGTDEIRYDSNGILLGPLSGALVEEDLRISAYCFPAGDLNEDGYDDLVGSRGSDVGIFLAPFVSDRDWDSADAQIVLGEGITSSFSTGDTRGIGDIDGDGRRDIAFSLFDAPELDNTVFAYVSPITGVLSADDAFLQTSGTSLRNVGMDGPTDLDGDGATDLVIGDRYFSDYVYHGGAAWVLLGPIGP